MGGQRLSASLASGFQLLLKCHASEFASASSLLGFFLPHPAPDNAGRFPVHFRFHLILSKRFRFFQNFNASSFCFFRFLSNCMLTAQRKTENLVCRKFVKFTA